MTKADRNRFYIYAVLQSKCGIGVTEIVKTNFRKTDAFNNRLFIVVAPFIIGNSLEYTDIGNTAV